MRTLRLVLGYDGTDFAGWQFQPGFRTVQGAVNDAFALLGDPGRSSKGSGRTDKGVHARGQVASMRTTVEIPVRQLLKALSTKVCQLVKSNQFVPTDERLL